MNENLDKWLKPEKKVALKQEKDKHIKDLIGFSKEEIQRFLDPDFVASAGLGKLGLMLLDKLKEDTIKKSLERDIEKREDKVRFLKEIEKEIKRRIKDCKNDPRIKDEKIKKIKKLLLNFVEEERRLEEDMGKQGYGDDDFLRPFG